MGHHKNAHARENAVQIALTRGQVAIVDAADYDRVRHLRWFARRTDGRWYAVCGATLLHRLIIDAPPRVPVGFANGDSLDCRRANLVLRRYAKAPRGEVLSRCELPAPEVRLPSTPHWLRRMSGAIDYVGVFKIRDDRYGAQIESDGIRRTLGTFSTARDAALAYNVAHRLLRGPDHLPPNDVEPAVPTGQLLHVASGLAESVTLGQRRGGRTLSRGSVQARNHDRTERQLMGGT